VLVGAFVGLVTASIGRADPPSFHRAPPWAASIENPYRRQEAAAQSGGRLFATYCAACHGHSAEGAGKAPALAHGRAQNAADGEVFWFITQGSRSGAMPSWAVLPEQQRWELVTYLRTLDHAPAITPTAATTSTTPTGSPPTAGTVP
jgi:mono/diheme cytochrome c family protein